MVRFYKTFLWNKDIIYLFENPYKILKSEEMTKPRHMFTFWVRNSKFVKKRIPGLSGKFQGCYQGLRLVVGDIDNQEYETICF